MSKKKKSLGIKIIITVICLLLAIAVAAGAWVIFSPNFKNKPVKENKNSGTASETEPVAALVEDLDDIVLSGELVEVTLKGDIAKIEIIAPGLDTYSMRLVMYDIKNDKVLSETEFPEAAWVTGITDNGFYAADQLRKTFYLYDFKGNLREEKIFNEADAWSSVCAVSEDENYYIYADIESGKIFVHDMKNAVIKTLALSMSFVSTYGFYDGKLYCRGADGEFAYLDIENSVVKTVYNDRRLGYITPTHGVGRTEYNYLSSTEDSDLFIPFYSADEIVVGVDEKVFTTAVSNNDKTILRVYNLKNNTVTRTYVEDTVESVHHLSDGRLLIVSGDVMKKKHRIYFCDISGGEKLSIEPSVTDRPKPVTNNSTNSSAKPGAEAVTVKNVPVISQFPNYPTGCESVSAVTVLRFLREEISVGDFVDNYLPKSADFYYEDGKHHGPDPNEYFIGNPRTASSYGCMAPVIEKALINYFGNSERVVNTTGMNMPALCSEYIDNGIPVMVWATINMVETVPRNSWYLKSGKRFTWPGNEHCLVLIGYDEGYYYFNDPYAGKTVKYEKRKAEDRYGEMGMQSIVVLPSQSISGKSN